jgi:hypothetical protein
MEGIMNLPADVGGATSQDGLDSFAPLIAAQQAARDMGYPRFTRELLSAGSEMDQAEVQEFLQTIRDAGLTSEDVAMMRRVVEAVFGDPNNYSQVRDRLLSEGIPEDLLPEMFDLEFFVALRMAVEEAENLSQESRPTGQGMPMEAPVGMAEGGIVGLPQLTPIAREMAAMGRNGDTMLAHITPQEAMMLKRMGGSGTINPYTGLPEFFIGKLFKSLVKGVKKFAKSTVGRIIISVALGAFLGPMATGFLTGAGVTVGAATAAGITAGVGVFGSSLLAGDGLKNSLRNGLTAGALSFGVAGVTQGFSAPATNAPANFAQGYEQGISNIKAPFQAAADFVRGGPEAAANVPASGVPAVSNAADLAKSTQVTPIPPDNVLESAIAPQSASVVPSSAPVVPPPAPVVPSNLPDPIVEAAAAKAEYFGQNDPGFQGAPSPTTKVTAADFASLGEPRNLLQRVYEGVGELFSPTATTPPKTVFEISAELRAANPGASQALIESEAKRLAAEQTPGFFARNKTPLLLGTTALAATGGLDSLFKVPSPEGMTQEEYDAQRAKNVAQFRQDRPEFFGSFLPSSQPTYRAAKGSGPEGVEDFPRKNGAINGPGTGTSDDIPAMLSDGEFVFTAKSVRNMGGGSRRKGAAKMYKLMKMLEGGPVGKTAKA